MGCVSTSCRSRATRGAQPDLGAAEPAIWDGRPYLPCQDGASASGYEGTHATLPRSRSVRPFRPGRMAGARLLGLVACATVLAVASTISDGSWGAVDAPTTSCPSSPRPTPRKDLPEQFKGYRRLRVFGSGVLWTVPPRKPTYSASNGLWTVKKQAWFRLSDEELTVQAERIDGDGGAFRADLPPMGSYPLDLNLHIGPGFMPSHLEFSAPGCWRVVATLGDSSVVFHVNVDASKRRVPH
jgi:hypothetical protein